LVHSSIKQFTYALLKQPNSWFLSQQECKSEGASSCECYSCDLGQQDQLTDFINQVENKSIDVLINNAGTFVPAEEEGPLKGDAARWHDMLHVNLTAPMFLTRAVAPKMVDKGAGCIINIGDVEGLHSKYTCALHAISHLLVMCVKQDSRG
jgi:short-subunit dehydrogenase